MKISKLLGFCAFLSLATYVFCGTITVSTPKGDIYGVEENGYRVFRGIPYAQPPTGQNRWKPPIPVESWSPAILDATTFGSCCPSSKNPGYNENCLFLNVWTPPLQDNTQKFPVMVYIHGGAFTSGCSSNPLFHGDYIANTTNTILVTINYRLGSLGFLSYEDEFVGNYGLMDQMAAFTWVQENIEYFGGDANSVTIFGQSAGAMSVAVHLTSPESYGKNYFHKAIVESDPFTMRYRTKEEMIPYAHVFAKELGCKPDDTACFYAASVDQIVAAQDNTWEIPWPPKEAVAAMPWEPTVDGTIVPDQPWRLFSNGKFYPVPIMMGTVQNESTWFAYDALEILGLEGVNDVEYIAVLTAFFGKDAPSVLEHYPPTGRDSLGALQNMATDFLFVCPTRYAAVGIAKSAPLHLYNFLHSPVTNPPNNNTWCLSDSGNVCHSAELAYVFHSIDLVPGYYQTDLEKRLSLQLMTYWTYFAHSDGSPEFTEWPLFSEDSLITMQWNLESDTVSGYKDSLCDFWDTLGYDW